jgi:hypothetical protein
MYMRKKKSHLPRKWLLGGSHVQRGTPATLYVDLVAPEVYNSPTSINVDGQIGINAIVLAGTAYDDLLLHQVRTSSPCLATSVGMRLFKLLTG